MQPGDRAKDRTLDLKPHHSAVEELEAFIAKEKREHGLEELHFCPGADREAGVEDMAKVALAMLRHRQSLRQA